MHEEPNPPTPSLDRIDAVPAPGMSRRIRSDELFLGVREVIIEHGGRQYQLRITQSGKLILTA